MGVLQDDIWRRATTGARGEIKGCRPDLLAIWSGFLDTVAYRGVSRCETIVKEKRSLQIAAAAQLGNRLLDRQSEERFVSPETSR
jgi:hypothetical protein